MKLAIRASKADAVKLQLLSLFEFKELNIRAAPTVIGLFNNSDLPDRIQMGHT